MAEIKSPIENFCKLSRLWRSSLISYRNSRYSSWVNLSNWLSNHYHHRCQKSIWKSEHFCFEYKILGMLGYVYCIHCMPNACKKSRESPLSFQKKKKSDSPLALYIPLCTMYKHLYISNVRQSIYTQKFIENRAHTQSSNVAFDFHNIYYFIIQ